MIIRKIQGDTIFFFDDDQLILTVEEKDTDDGILMSFRGALKSEVTHHIQDELDAFIAIGVKVSIDFKEATFVSASLLNALLDSQQLVDFFRKGEILLKNIPDAVCQAMDETGISERLMVEEWFGR